jgi:hypothetical protein
MDVKRSPLQQNMFVILKTDIEFVTSGTQNKKNPVDDLNIEFDLLTNKNNDHNFRVIFRIEAKKYDDLGNGLDICVHAGCDFDIDGNLDQNDTLFNQLVKYSTISIAYNNVRNYLQTISSLYPTPIYILPTIDVNDLWEKKNFVKETAEPKIKKRTLQKKQ